MIVARTCTGIPTGEQDRLQPRDRQSRPLEEFRDAPAYVLVGDPGAGKTTAFETECEALGGQACLVSARDFQTFDPKDHPEWRGKILFIDGLDEIRAGADDARTPFDQIRKRLDMLGKPSFRLSCRAADWLGANDRRHLESVSPDSKVMVLRLNPLTESDIAEILKTRPDVDDVEGFIGEANKRGIDGLIANPQTLDLLAKVVAGSGSWPKSCLELFDRACSQMVREHNEGHQAAQGLNSTHATDQLLDAAGRLCAIQLISGAAGYTLRGEPEEDFPSPDQCGYDRREMLQPALATKLFKGAFNNHFIPVHRRIAEYLGARHLAGVIHTRLPARRVLALITGEDGIVVTEMRGLSAWLAAHCSEARADLIERDPIGVGLYGDIRGFTTGEKRTLLKALKCEASRLGSVFLKTEVFAGLATPDMEPVLGEILKDSARDEDHQTFIGFLLDVLSESGSLPNLSELLLEMVRDDTWRAGIDLSALDAFIKNCPDSRDKTNKLEVLLVDIQNGNVSGPNIHYFESLITQQLEPVVPNPISKSASEDMSLEVRKKHTWKNERIKAITDIKRMRPSWATPSESQAKEQRQREEKRFAYIRSNEAALRENHGAPILLYELAKVYFGLFTDISGKEGPERIARSLKNDRGLIEASLQGIQGAIYREDVPDIDEILRLQERGHMHYIGLPFLAGLAELERTAPEDVPRWDKDRICKALAFYFCTPHGEYRPGWYQQLLETCPEIVAEVQVRLGVSEFRSGREQIYKLWEFAHDQDHAQVAKHASLPLLRAFPTRCKLNQIKNLDYLLWAAIQHAERSSLQELIERKLSRKSMNDAQRVRWLAAGVIVSPTEYRALLNDFAKGNEHRIRQISAFFCPEDSVWFLFEDLGIPVLELLTLLVGSCIGPHQRRGDATDGDEGELVGPEMRAAWLVYRLIQCLAAFPAKDASVALNRLLSDPALSRWRDVLSRAQNAQRVIRRDANYRHPNIEKVCRTLNGGTPANAADLAALLMDLLQKLAEEIRTGNTDDWRQYWNEPHGQFPTPKHEDHCRDALLSALRQRLAPAVDAQPEGQYANDTRADIRVSCRDFQVPMEIKKNQHRDLWSAPRKQLIAKYTTDPATGGYGIYLVFWFGRKDTSPPPSGAPPATATELQDRLQATLTPVEARKISICVVDVSRPDG